MTAEKTGAKTSTDRAYVLRGCQRRRPPGFLRNTTGVGEAFSLSEEQGAGVAVEGSTAFITGRVQVGDGRCRSGAQARRSVQEGCRRWLARAPPALFAATRRFQTRYIATGEQLDSASKACKPRSKPARRFADVGEARSVTIRMAQHYPKFTFVGFDYHEPSIRYARDAACGRPGGDRVKLEAARRRTSRGARLRRVAFFDCLHDMGDPIGAADPTWRVDEA